MTLGTCAGTVPANDSIILYEMFRLTFKRNRAEMAGVGARNVGLQRLPRGKPEDAIEFRRTLPHARHHDEGIFLELLSPAPRGRREHQVRRCDTGPDPRGLDRHTNR